jgi:hypothetical protein
VPSSAACKHSATVRAPSRAASCRPADRAAGPIALAEPVRRYPAARLDGPHAAVNRRVVGSSPTRGASKVLETGTN